MLNIKKIKNDFPILGREINGHPLVYLDNSATTQKPAQVISAISEYYKKHNANTHRGIHTLGEEATEIQELGRERVASFINASPEEIIFTRNATESLNLVAYAYGLANLKKGDRVVITRMEHHANILPWQMVCDKTGAKLEYWELDENGELVDIQDSPLVDEKAKILSLTQASNVLGTINPVREIAAFAKRRGITVIADAAQSAPNMPIDVKDLGVDFLAFSGHKMLAPMGIGVLFGRKELLEQMPPFLRGGSMIDVVSEESSTWNKVPFKFEAGTPDVASVAGLICAIDYLENLGVENILKHEREIGAYIIDRLSEYEGIKILGPHDPEKRVGLVSFTLNCAHPHDIAEIFNKNGIAIRSGHHCAQLVHKYYDVMASARISPYVYNSKEDVNAAIAALRQVIDIFK